MKKQITACLAASFLLSGSMTAVAYPQDCEELVETLDKRFKAEGKSFDLIIVEKDETVEDGRDVGFCGGGYKVVYREITPS
jgi:hypothetical protein